MSLDLLPDSRSSLQTFLSFLGTISASLHHQYGVGVSRIGLEQRLGACLEAVSSDAPPGKVRVGVDLPRCLSEPSQTCISLQKPPP